jgi:hypothetical protein
MATSGKLHAHMALLPEERDDSAHSIGGWVGPRASHAWKDFCKRLFLLTSKSKSIQTLLLIPCVQARGSSFGKASNLGVGLPKNYRSIAGNSIASKPTRLSTQWVLRTMSSELKQPWREVKHSPPPSAQVRNMWWYFIPLLLHNVVLIKHGKKITFTSSHTYYMSRPSRPSSLILDAYVKV